MGRDEGAWEEAGRDGGAWEAGREVGGVGCWVWALGMQVLGFVDAMVYRCRRRADGGGRMANSYCGLWSGTRWWSTFHCSVLEGRFRVDLQR